MLLNLQAWRVRCLQEVVGANVEVITADMCARWFHHIQTYLARCMHRTSRDRRIDGSEEEHEKSSENVDISYSLDVNVTNAL